MPNRTILIAGAGIAGPALAYWLCRHGFTATVVERAPSLREGGYAVDFRGAAMRVLERMDVLGDVQRAQTNMGAVAYVNQANKRLATIPAEFLSGEVEILRGDLSRILYAATADDTEYIFDNTITGLCQHDDGVEVSFARGPARTFDLVVGADGLHSQVRALAFGDEAHFRRDLGYYVAIFTTANHLGLDHTGLYYSMPGKLAAIYSARNNSEAKASFYFASPPLSYDYRDIAQQKRLVAERFASEGWEVPRLLQAMWGASDFYFDSISQIHMDTWSQGRVVLLGDAGYCASPLSGMGSGLALVGAYVLAGELAAASGEHQSGFARYEGAMRNYVRECQQLAEGGGSWFVPSSRAMIWFRNLNLRILPYLPWKGVIANGPLKAANAIVLTDYEARPAMLHEARK